MRLILLQGTYLNIMQGQYIVFTQCIGVNKLLDYSNPLIPFSTHDELLTSGAKIEKLIVAHPALSQPTEVQILYIAYEGWIYSGR